MSRCCWTPRSCSRRRRSSWARAAGDRVTPLRIAIDIRALAEGPSGVATYLRNLVPAMLERSPAQFLFVHDAARRPDVLDKWLGGNWRAMPVPHAPEQIWEQVLLPVWLRRHGADVFHWPSGAGGLALRPIAGAKIVVTVHDVIPLIYPEYFRSAMHRRYFNFLLALSRRADAVITVSEASKKDLVARGHLDPSKITVIGESVEGELISPSPSAAGPASKSPSPSGGGQGGGMGSPYILAMGSGEPRKNVGRVIEAFMRIADRIPHELLIVGAPWRGRGVTIPPGARIRALGGVSNAQLRELYANAAVFVYPSLYEGFGLPVLEAMACGTPVITSRAGSLPEVAGPAAVYVDPQDAGAIASAILEVVTNPARRSELVDAGRARLSIFSWETAARQTLEVYERIGKKSPSPFGGGQGGGLS